MKNSLALVITEEDRKYIRGIYKSNINEQNTSPSFQEYTKNGVIPPELNTEEKRKAFIVYMNGEDPTWYKGGIIPEEDMADTTLDFLLSDGVWDSHKDAYLLRINANNNANSGGVQKVEDGWYYVDSNGAQQGPVKLSDLKGKITNDTYLFNGKLTSNWSKAGDAGMRAQIGDLIGPPTFKKPEDEKSDADEMLKSNRSIDRVDYQKVSTIAAPITTTTTTKKSSAPVDNSTTTTTTIQ
jgi:hypothetical protein